MSLLKLEWERTSEKQHEHDNHIFVDQNTLNTQLMNERNWTKMCEVDVDVPVCISVDSDLTIVGHELALRRRNVEYDGDVEQRQKGWRTCASGMSYVVFWSFPFHYHLQLQANALIRWDWDTIFIFSTNIFFLPFFEHAHYELNAKVLLPNASENWNQNFLLRRQRHHQNSFSIISMHVIVTLCLMRRFRAYAIHVAFQCLKLNPNVNMNPVRSIWNWITNVNVSITITMCYY